MVTVHSSCGQILYRREYIKHAVGIYNLLKPIPVSSCSINGEGKEACLSELYENIFKLMHVCNWMLVNVNRCEQISCRLGMIVDFLLLHHLIPVLITLILHWRSQGREKARILQSFCCRVHSQFRCIWDTGGLGLLKLKYV